MEWPRELLPATADPETNPRSIGSRTTTHPIAVRAENQQSSLKFVSSLRKERTFYLNRSLNPIQQMYFAST
ncbi:hypothetical protein chiPu_0009107 [Chiloscyllium punctatum]|uniref:Uncharacterized protein n=1 Tax=Chiloscyllium punctatum TaxID=137246 RepID=A0A401SJR5_CHIPU|nr:hypothetical protein [Chiloscyllium punctatum]